MPDKDGKLTPEETANIQKWMSGYGTGLHPCPICQSTLWTIGEYLVFPITMGVNYTPNFGGLKYPNVLLLSPCGYTRYMNAVIMGIAMS